MKTTIEIIPDQMQWQVTFEIVGGGLMILRGGSDLGSGVVDCQEERIAACYRDASWQLTAAILNELRKTQFGG